MRKTKIAAAIALIAVAVTLLAFAAFGDVLPGKPVSFYPGTEDTVGNMPEDGVLGEESDNSRQFVIPDTVPTREGFDFLGWVLDFGVPAEVYYTVQYLDLSTFQRLREDKVVCVPCGTFVTEYAEEIEGYFAVNGPIEEEITKNGKFLVFYYFSYGDPDVG